jgi:hypothetical protein
MYQKLDDLMWAWDLPPYGEKNDDIGYDFILRLMQNPVSTKKSIRAMYLATVIKTLIDKGNVVTLLKKGGFYTTDDRLLTERSFRRYVKKIDHILRSHGEKQAGNFDSFHINRAADIYPDFSSVIKFTNYLGADSGWVFNRVLIHDVNMSDSIELLMHHYKDLLCNENVSQCEEPVVWFGKIAASVMNSEALRLGCGL